MRVKQHPYELLVLLADQHAEVLLSGLIQRGQERGCLSDFRFCLWRNAKGRHDDFWRHSEGLLPPALSVGCRVLAVWDHHGSGREKISPKQAESEALQCLARCHVTAELALTVALEPELEILLCPVWDKVKDLLAQERGKPPPPDREILKRAGQLFKSPIPNELPLPEALRRYPKEMIDALRQLLKLGTLGTVHERVGSRLSIQALKGPQDELPERPAARIARHLVKWFPGPQALQAHAGSPLINP